MKKSKFSGAIFFLLIVNFVFLILHSSSYALDAQRMVLDNGLVLLVAQRDNLPIVKVSMGIRAGSVVEPAEKAGLASLTASLLTDGTKSRTSAQISEEIEFVGGELGASGGDDYITVNLSVLKKDMDLGFALLSDIILNPTFPEDEMTKKKERIKGSLRAQEEDPGFVASREFKKAVFGDHPYGRLVTGTAGTIDRITRDDLIGFHAACYVPNNTIMAVVGQTTPEEVKELLQKYFSGWKRGQSGLPQPAAVTEGTEKNTIMIDRDLTQANIIMGHKGVSRDNPDYYALSVLNYILGGGGFASRLMLNIRKEKGLVYDIHSYFEPNKYGGSFQVGLQTKNESANTAIAEVVREIQRIRKEPVSEAELSDAQAFLTGSFPMRIETSQRIAGFLVAVEYYNLGIDYIDKYPVYINGVTRDDILRVADKYLHPDQFVMVVVADQAKTQLRKEFQP